MEKTAICKKYNDSEEIVKECKNKLSFLMEEFNNIKNDVKELRQSLTKDEISSKTFRKTKQFKDLEKTTQKNRDELFNSKSMLEFLSKLPKELNDLHLSFIILKNAIQKEKNEPKKSGELLYNSYSMCTLFDSVLLDIYNQIELKSK